MSTERPDNDVTGPRRRSPLAVASVAAAVLLAGGGGAYWAATAADNGGGTDAGGRAAPPALALDGPARTGADTPPEGASRGIAPGEPDPSGGRMLYRASGELPDGPRTAAVRRAAGTVSADEVARLAKALGLAGAPQEEATYWKVGSEGDGTGPVLRVEKRAPGTWSFARYGSGGTDNCKKGATCSGGQQSPDGGASSASPVSGSAARAAAAPVLKAAGQDGAALDTRQLMGSVRVVNADPTVDGLPTYGWSTGIQVGPDGQVVGGSGHLKGLEKGDSYPVVGADEALAELNGPEPRPKGDTCNRPVPAGHVRCMLVLPDPPARTAMTVEKAVFGLSAQYVAGRQALVPSWLFSVRPAAGGAGSTVAQVAVEPAYLTRSAPSAGSAVPTPPGNAAKGQRQSLSYRAEGRELSVTFWGGACSTYAASATETADTVTVRVAESAQQGKQACIMVAKELTRTVTLEAPLGDRKVVDAVSGGEVPRD
ncbi:hypothetical protein AB0467_04040 [Streptomyces sp. NPDC052095]|uniref:hypothetical protein n=1 Tax=unclassified Streptomyces TaxID=2593676 RepID=UPI00344D5408